MFLKAIAATMYRVTRIKLSRMLDKESNKRKSEDIFVVFFEEALLVKHP